MRLLEQAITVHIEPREDGGVRIWSDDLPGLILSHHDQELVIGDIGAAILGLLRHRARRSVGE